MSNETSFHSSPFSYVLNGLYEAHPEALRSPEAEKTARAEPISWVLDTMGLYTAARALADADVSGPDYSLVPGLAQYNDTRVKAASLMLLGFSLEVVLKGLIRFVQTYRHENWASRPEKKKLESHLHTHDLVGIAGHFWGFNERQAMILGVLQEFVIWAGRYSSPKERWSGEAIAKLRATSEIQPPITFEELTGLVDKLRIESLEEMKSWKKLSEDEAAAAGQ